MLRVKQFFALLLFAVFYFPNVHAMDWFTKLIFEDDTPSQTSSRQTSQSTVGAANDAAPKYTLPESLTDSVVIAYDNDLIVIFQALEEEAKKNPTRPLISYLINPYVPVVPKSHIKYGLNHNKFNENDLWWVIKHYSTPSDSSVSQQTTQLFEEFVLNIKPEFKSRLIAQMNKIAIKKSEHDENQNIRDETFNIFSAMIEKDFSGAFQQILEAYPESLNLILTDEAITRKELDSVTGIPLISRQYNYKPFSYKLVPWLVCKIINTGKSLFGKENSVDPKYIEAAKFIVMLYRKSGLAHDDVENLINVMTAKGHLEK